MPRKPLTKIICHVLHEGIWQTSNEIIKSVWTYEEDFYDDISEINTLKSVLTYMYYAGYMIRRESKHRDGARGKCPYEYLLDPNHAACKLVKRSCDSTKRSLAPREMTRQARSDL